MEQLQRLVEQQIEKKREDIAEMNAKDDKEDLEYTVGQLNAFRHVMSMIRVVNRGDRG